LLDDGLLPDYGEKGRGDIYKERSSKRKEEEVTNIAD